MTTEEEMRKQKKTRRLSESPSSPPPPPPLPLSFTSLPPDVVLNCMTRISRSNHPILSLVSKSFQSLLASPNLEAERSLKGKPEKLLYVCLSLKNNPNWFVLSPSPKPKLIPIQNFPRQHPYSSTVVSIGSDIYILGGYIKAKKKRSKRVFLLDCKSHQWRQLPKMCVSRKEAAGFVLNGKIYVVGGCKDKYNNTASYGEVYDPKTQTWEPTVTEMGKQLDRDKTGNRLGSTACWVELKNHDPSRCVTKIFNGELRCGAGAIWYRVSGLEKLYSNYLISVANPDGGSRVIVWWKIYTKECKTTEIWCAEVLIECFNRNFQGTFEWSENVFTFQGCESGLLMHSALVTHDF